jgi:hypothetical protein
MMTTPARTSDIMAKLKPTLDTFSKKYASRDLDDTLRVELTNLIDLALRAMGYDDRLVRLVEPEPNGDTTVIVCTRDDQDKADSKFAITTITIRGRVVPEEIQ